MDSNPSKGDRDKDLRPRINQGQSLEIEIIETETIARKIEMIETQETKKNPASKEISTLIQIQTIGYIISMIPNFTKW